jgi:polysaccharide deacetylase 2 family uncharacterized protein YibQ
MAPMMAELGKRGLMYLDDGSFARSVAAGEALKSGAPLPRATPRLTPCASAAKS